MVAKPHKPTSHKCAETIHMSSQQNVAWQSGLQRVVIPNGSQPYYKRFSHGFPILGTFG